MFNHRYGASAERLTVDDYDFLLDRGWMRSGDFMYHPYNQRACCPNLVIRLDIRRFMYDKQHEKALRRLHEMLRGDRTIVHDWTAIPRPEALRLKKLALIHERWRRDNNWKPPSTTTEEVLRRRRESGRAPKCALDWLETSKNDRTAAGEQARRREQGLQLPNSASESSDEARRRAGSLLLAALAAGWLN